MTADRCAAERVETLFRDTAALDVEDPQTEGLVRVWAAAHHLHTATQRGDLRAAS